MNVSRLKFPLLITVAGLALGLVGDLFFYGNPLGISVPILTTAFLIALGVLVALEKLPVTWANVWLAVPLLFLSAMSAVRALPLLRFLNVSSALLVAILLAHSLATQPLFRLNVGGYLGIFIEAGILILPVPVLLIKRSIKVLDKHGGGRLLRRLLVGMLIAAPLLLAFAALFASADPIFRDLVDDVLRTNWVGHTLLTCTLAWLMMGLLGYALKRPQDPADFFGLGQGRALQAEGEGEKGDETENAASKESSNTSTESRRGLRSLLGTLEASVVLFSIDVLFLAFVAVQFAAHFGGEAFLQKHDLTYSEYARQGFFELLVVSLMTLGLILILDFITRRENARQQLAFLLGSGMMLMMTIIILASAFHRLRLYELAYGFTRLRLYTHVFMAWLAALLAAFLVMLSVRRVHLFATAALIAALGFTATLDVLNPDALILQRNLERYRRGEELDVAYLGSLSADAVPGLLTLLDADDAEIREEAGPWLRRHLDRLDAWQEEARWPSYHYSLERAYRLLDRQRDEIEAFEPASSTHERLD